MIAGKTKTLSAEKIAKEVQDFSTKNRLSADEKKELEFILKTFCKFYNKMAESDEEFVSRTVVELFDGVLESITETYNGTGVQTRANLFWKQVPTIKAFCDGKEPNDEKNQRTTSTSSNKSHSSATYSYQDTGYSYGGCGGGYGGYGGGHC